MSTKPTPKDPVRKDNPMNYLHSDSEKGEVRQVTVKNQGSKAKCAKVTVQGIPVYGIIVELISPSWEERCSRKSPQSLN